MAGEFSEIDNEINRLLQEAPEAEVDLSLIEDISNPEDIPIEMEERSVGPATEDNGEMKQESGEVNWNVNNGDMKAGDWFCPECGDHQFARNRICRKCGTPNPIMAECIWCQRGECWTHGQIPRPPPGFYKGYSYGKMDFRKKKGPEEGDWLCPACWDHQSKDEVKCTWCGHAHPLLAKGEAIKGGLAPAAGSGKGDWTGAGKGDWKGAGKSDWTGAGKGDWTGVGKGDWMGAGKGDWTGVGKGDWTGNAWSGKSGWVGGGADWSSGGWTGSGAVSWTGGSAAEWTGSSQGAWMGSSWKGGSDGKGASDMGVSGGLVDGTPYGTPLATPMEEGDWICSECRNHEHKRNVICTRCGALRPEGGVTAELAGAVSGAPVLAGGPLQGGGKGDWMGGGLPKGGRTSCKWCLMGECWTHQGALKGGASPGPY